MRTIRELLAGLFAVLPLAAIVIVGVVLTPRLGPVIASHWSGGSPYPDGFSSTRSTFVGFTGTTAALLVASVAIMTVARRVTRARVWAALATTIGGFMAVAWIASASATASAPTPHDARLGWRLTLLVLALGCGALVYLLLPAPPAPITADATRPQATLPVDGSRGSWSGEIVSRPFETMVAAVAALLVGCIVLALTLREANLWFTVGIVAVATALCVAIVPVRLTVDERGIRLTSVILRVPLIRVPLADIESVAVDTIEPRRWGGWGYRLSASGVAYVTRRGPGIIITRRGGGANAITLDTPDAPAAVANALVGRRGAQN